MTPPPPATGDTTADRRPAFGTPDLARWLSGAPDADLDRLDFGVIGFDDDEIVTAYNRFEAERAGLDPERVLGHDLFTEVAPCTNNHLVAERYREHRREGRSLDEELDYVFTLRMRPTPVRLRLLSEPDDPRSWLVVLDRTAATITSDSPTPGA